jgi:hypothetical protein
MWGSTYRTPALLGQVAATFDAAWYVATYQRDLQAHAKPGESPLDFYLRTGARIGHDPHPTFSELYFRTANEAAYRRVLRTSQEFGYLLLLGGFRGLFTGAPRTANAAECENWRIVTTAIDRDFVAANYSIDRSQYVSELDFYVRGSRQQAISPSADFREADYRRAHTHIDNDIRKGKLISGYHEFLAAQLEYGGPSAANAAARRDEAIPGADDGIRYLERTIPGSTRPLELGLINEIDYLAAPVTIKRSGRKGRGFLVCIPYFIPELFFGGYGAFFALLRKLKELGGGDLKLVVVRKIPSKDDLRLNIERIRHSMPEVASLFSSYHLLQEDRTIEVDGDCGVISFCAETHFIASDAARQLGVAPYFHIPDYEPDFSSAGSVRSFVRSSYDLPHRGLYNSQKLHEYFRDVAAVQQVRDAAYRYVTYENPIKPMPWGRQKFLDHHAGKDKKRLIVYARPEFVGARNDFALIVLALKQALRSGCVDETRWTFHGIGAMAAYSDIELSPRSRLDIIPKLPPAEYEDFLLQGDVGISVISTPHPGIIHFQMAAFGLTTITYATANRSADWLRSQSRNLIPCQPSIEGLCKAIGRAVAESADLAARYENTQHALASAGADDIEAAAKFCLIR